MKTTEKHINIIDDAGVTFEDTATAFAPKSDFELRRSHYLFKMINYRLLVKMGTWLVKQALQWNLPVKQLIKKTLFAQFCGGETINDCNQTISKLSHFRVGTILDYAVEGATDEQGYRATEEETLANIGKAAISFDIPFCVFKVTGLAPTPVLAKLHAGQTLTPEEQAAWERVKARVDRICQEAHEKKVRLFIDAEESWIQQPIDDLANQMMRKYNQDEAIVYNTFQMYLTRKEADLRAAFQLAVRYRYYLGVKLVRGAYMEKERARAAEKGYPDPVQPDKEKTDLAFDRGLKFCVQNQQRVALCAGTHNEYSSYYLTVLMNKFNIKPENPNFFFAQLYGMSDHISFNLSSQGYNVAKYVPYGPLKSVMPYLFRRAEENTSVAGQSGREYTLVKRELQRRRKQQTA